MSSLYVALGGLGVLLDLAITVAALVAALAAVRRGCAALYPGLLVAGFAASLSTGAAQFLFWQVYPSFDFAHSEWLPALFSAVTGGLGIGAALLTAVALLRFPRPAAAVKAHHG
jgi:hypothetical protein